MLEMFSFWESTEILTFREIMFNQKTTKRHTRLPRICLLGDKTDSSD